jgi:hypothetical protein
MKPEDLIAWANTLSNNPETPGGTRGCLDQIAEALGDALRDSRRFEGYARDRLAIAIERDEARSDYESLEEDAARVVLAYLHGDKIELDETIGKMMDNGREKWWEAHRPAGLRGEGDTL